MTPDNDLGMAPNNDLRITPDKNLRVGLELRRYPLLPKPGRNGAPIFVVDIIVAAELSLRRTAEGGCPYMVWSLGALYEA
jgi:hypothetical protein